MAGTELSVHEVKPQVHLDKIFLCSGAISLRVVAFAQQTMNATDRKLQSSTT